MSKIKQRTKLFPVKTSPALSKNVNTEGVITDNLDPVPASQKITFGSTVNLNHVRFLINGVNHCDYIEIPSQIRSVPNNMVYIEAECPKKRIFQFEMKVMRTQNYFDLLTPNPSKSVFLVFGEQSIIMVIEYKIKMLN